LGKLKKTCNTTELGYHLMRKVKPYLSSDVQAVGLLHTGERLCNNLGI